MQTGVIIGRFQPWHIRHQKLYEEVKRECDSVAILIYSPPSSLSNPFKPDEVYRMIRNDPAVKENEDATDISIIESTKNPPKLRGRITKAIENYKNTVFFTRDYLVQLGLNLLGFRVIKKDGERCLSATEIREMIYQGNENYRRFVNKYTASLIDDLFPGRYDELRDIGYCSKRDFILF